MAKHQGQLKVNYSPSTAAASKAAGLLRGAVTAAAGAAVSAATAATAAGSTDADTQGRPGSNSATPKAGAGAAAGAQGTGSGVGTGSASGSADGAAESELLKILTPELGSAAGAASGMRILSHQVPEMELQATATEMQVIDDGAVMFGMLPMQGVHRIWHKQLYWLQLPCPSRSYVVAICLTVQRLLLMGRRHEALDVALAGQLWGPALVLAHGYGELPHLLAIAHACARSIKFATIY